MAGSKRMGESCKINKSLFALANVVNAVNKREGRIPYRNSKLTRLLQDSLGGGSYGTIICTLAPSWQYHAFTSRSLQFAQKGRRIYNAPVQSLANDMTDANNNLATPRKIALSSSMKDRLKNWKEKKNKLKLSFKKRKRCTNPNSTPRTQSTKKKHNEELKKKKIWNSQNYKK